MLHSPEGRARSFVLVSRAGGWASLEQHLWPPRGESWPVDGAGQATRGPRWLPQCAGRVSRHGLTVFLGGHEVVSGAVTRQEARSGFSLCGRCSRPGRKARVWALGGFRICPPAGGGRGSRDPGLPEAGGLRPPPAPGAEVGGGLEGDWMEPAPRPAPPRPSPVPRRSGPYARPVCSAQEWRRHRPVSLRSALGDTWRSVRSHQVGGADGGWAGSEPGADQSRTARLLGFPTPRGAGLTLLRSPR